MTAASRILTIAPLVLAAVAGRPSATRAQESSLAPPSNDECMNAIPIPPSSLPYLTAPVDLREATAAGEPALCSGTTRTVWYTFTPTVTADYEFTTCREVAIASNLYSAVLSVMLAPSCAGTFTTVQCSFRDALCGEEIWQPRVTVNLTAATTYYIAVGAIAQPSAGMETVQVHASLATPPANDRCSAAQPVAARVLTTGTLALAANDYIVPSGSTCYSLPSGPPAPVGQTFSNASGRDVVYSFTPQATGSYSFKTQLRRDGYNLVTYVSALCETGASPEPVDTCIGAANRNTSTIIWTAAEEVACVPLLGGQTYYVYIDEYGSGGTSPTQFQLEVTPCLRETEPNDSPASAGAPPSGVEGATGTPSDVDYVSLGQPPVGTRVFAVADQVAVNTTAIRMRITDSANTLEFDDDDNSQPWGVLSANVAGRALEGQPSYIQIDPNSTTTLSEPYRLTYVLQPPGSGLGGSSATPHSEEADTAPPHYNVAGNMYFSGAISYEGDLDRFRFCAHAGDEVYVSLDCDPLRDDTPFDGALLCYNTLGRGLGFYNSNAASDKTPGTGSLSALTPHSPGDAVTWRALKTGYHRIVVDSEVEGVAGLGDYLLSIAVNGRTGAEQSVDLAVEAGDTPDPVSTGATLTYTVTVTNGGPDIALLATLTDTLPAGTTFQSLEGGGSGGVWTCALPPVGAHGTITCQNSCFEDGGAYTFTIRVKLDDCLGQGTILTNSPSIGSLTTESSGGNNAVSTTTTVADDGSCDDGSVCTSLDACAGTTCVGSLPLNCDDGEACTIDSCDAIAGCRNVPLPLPAEVDDSVRLAKVGSDTEVSWSDAPGPFNVYRGNRPAASAWAYNHACVAASTEGPYTDPTTPSILEFFYYLVSRENACGQESSVGHDSQGTPDPNTNPCP